LDNDWRAAIGKHELRRSQMKQAMSASPLASHWASAQIKKTTDFVFIFYDRRAA
jgi:hypothetical protein